jgi:hypothetical protein
VKKLVRYPSCKAKKGRSVGSNFTRPVSLLFGDHIIAMLIRGSAHLAQHVDRLAKELEINIPVSNPFRIGK